MIHIRYDHVILSLLCMLLGACTVSPATPRPVPASALLVDTVVFPAGWTTCGAPCASMDHDYPAARSFGHSTTSASAIQDVYGFRSIAEAQAKYEDIERTFFAVTGFGETRPFWKLDTHPSDSLLQADSYIFGCGVDQSPECRSMARYGQYVVLFTFDIVHWDDVEGLDGGRLTLAEVRDILRRADDHIHAQLGSP